MDDRDGGQAALTQLRAFLAQNASAPNTRLPPERELCGVLGVSRGELRKALAVLEGEGTLWRHVGKGTFAGSRPIGDALDLSGVTNRTNPSEVMRARILIEPEIAREAALHATSADISELRQCLGQSRTSATWRQYESWDNRLHRTIAQATRNALLLALFDQLNAVRRTVVWGRLRVEPLRPPSDHHSFTEHEIIVAAIEERDLDGAARAMRTHLRSVERHLLALAWQAA